MRLTEIILHVIECKQQNVNSGFNKIGFRIFANGQKPPQRPRIEGSYLDQILPQHERLYPIGLKLARIEIPHGGNSFTW